MNLAHSYQILGLNSEATFEEIKASYRQLARRYHPDVSSGDQRTKDKFIEVTAAYKSLVNALAESTVETATSFSTTVSKAHRSAPKPAEKGARAAVQLQVNPKLSSLDQQLKISSYQQLQQLLKGQRFPRAIALVEGLARRLPQDSEVTQWQAIVYQQWGRHLIRDRQIDKARLYLKKALRTDPHNRSLWAEIEKDFRYIEQHF